MSSCTNYSGFGAREELSCGGVWSEESLRIEAMELVQVFFFFFFFLLTSEHNDPVKCVLLENFIDQLSSPRLKES